MTCELPSRSAIEWIGVRTQSVPNVNDRVSDQGRSSNYVPPAIGIAVAPAIHNMSCTSDRDQQASIQPMAQETSGPRRASADPWVRDRPVPGNLP
jgi:hypothetical protein